MRSISLIFQKKKLIKANLQHSHLKNHHEGKMTFVVIFNFRQPPNEAKPCAGVKGV